MQYENEDEPNKSKIDQGELGRPVISFFLQMFWERLSIVSCLKDRKLLTKFQISLALRARAIFRPFVVFERFTRAKNQIALEIVLLPIQKCQFISLLIFTGRHTKWGGQERSASGWRLALRGGNITEKKIRERGASQKEKRS